MLVEQRGGVEVMDHQFSGGLSTPGRVHFYKKKHNHFKEENQNIINYQKQSFFFINIILFKIHLPGWPSLVRRGTANPMILWISRVQIPSPALNLFYKKNQRNSFFSAIIIFDFFLGGGTKR